MATRKKSVRKKAIRKKAPRKKAPRKKAPKRKATKKKATRKTASSKKRKATRKKATRKKAPARKSAAKKAPDAAAAMARKIIAATTDPSKFNLEDLYAPDCVSIEGNGMRVEGYAGLREKGAGWEAGLDSATWVARQIFTRPDAVGIEWDAQIKFKDGRSVNMHEFAVHELRGGKIVAERYFYDPGPLAPPPQEAPAPPPKPYEPDPIPLSDDASGIDPLDL